MLFTDPLFLFYFLPAALLLLRVGTLSGRLATLGKVIIILSTLAFYAYGNVLWPVLFLVVVGGTYVFSVLIGTAQSQAARRIWMWITVFYALAALGTFKYLNWLAEFIPALKPFQSLLLPYFGANGAVVLPPGISFFVFEALSFAIDVYRRKIIQRVGPLDYLTFLAMFPRFIAGPIVRYEDIGHQFVAWSGLALSRGLTIFAIGFSMKTLFADQFATFVPYAFSVAAPDLLQAWTGALAYTYQLYFDFWAYSLMATGLGLCLGFEFPDNFLGPYRSKSITEFWKRWHVTLSSWLRTTSTSASAGIAVPGREPW